MVRDALAFERAHQRWTRDEAEQPPFWKAFQIWDPVSFAEQFFDFCPVPFEATY